MAKRKVGMSDWIELETEVDSEADCGDGAESWRMEKIAVEWPIFWYFAKSGRRK